MKLDVEGEEYAILPGLMLSGELTRSECLKMVKLGQMCPDLAHADVHEDGV
jgi:hypothetical protein